MSKQRRRRQHRQPARSPVTTGSATPFTPVTLRPRHDGWTPARQEAFIRTLAECANVEEAGAAVGMSPRSAYTLRARADAGSFRQAWDAALDYGVGRLEDAMLGRALHGVAVPVFYQGEQIGERRRYDEQLAMFILRARAPERYGKWRDGLMAKREHPDGVALMLQRAILNLAEDNLADEAGRPRRERPPLRRVYLAADPAEREAMDEERQRQDAAARQASFEAYLQTLRRHTGLGSSEDDYVDDVARTS
ncbi:hypothetical protein [Sphingomonas lenta]|uniref:Terminase n=1 Tax=Sphingomonas lenta TaxID=1141887 RepID=A0A2A2SBL7_9SPHN|nr:hypothetical protein [Sphingomonas lenta]PAX06646.1 hypothetical protein CKY28_16030 [Sphingomonas lenta]